jgi:hypothetical protein
MGFVMVMFFAPAFLCGCSVLGWLYASLASHGQAGTAVFISCFLKAGLVLIAPASGFLGGHVISDSPPKPVSMNSDVAADTETSPILQ